MKTKLYIVGILMLLLMPIGMSNAESNNISQSNNMELSPKFCGKAPIGISFGRTSGWLHNWCQTKTTTMTWIGQPKNETFVIIEELDG